MQEKLFYEDEYEALNLMVSCGKKTYKELACYLLPHLKPASAYARLKACLNPDKDERLTFGQIIASMNFCENFAPLMYACDETSHARPRRQSQDEKEMVMLNAVKEAANALQSAMRQLEAVQQSRS
jgi:hypothetical protein